MTPLAYAPYRVFQEFVRDAPCLGGVDPGARNGFVSRTRCIPDGAPETIEAVDALRSFRELGAADEATFLRLRRLYGFRTRVPASYIALCSARKRAPSTLCRECVLVYVLTTTMPRIMCSRTWRCLVSHRISYSSFFEEDFQFYTVDAEAVIASRQRFIPPARPSGASSSQEGGGDAL